MRSTSQIVEAIQMIKLYTIGHSNHSLDQFIRLWRKTAS
jgi:hypothetical protein